MGFDISRRAVVEGAAGLIGVCVVGGGVKALAGENTPLRPPGAQDENHFLATCLKCNRCVSICPQGSIRYATLTDGVLNWRTPVMDFHAGICDFCGRCEDVCPTGSIHDISKETSRIGVAVIDTERCISFAGSGCQVCASACPYGAISLDANGRPVVDESKCNGCGICENKCPSNSYRAYLGGHDRGINVRLKEA